MSGERHDQDEVIAATITAGAAVAVLSGGIVYASTSSTVINASVAKANGQLHVPADGVCPTNSTAVSWNQQGPPGPQGAAGPQGLQGEPGAGVTCRTQRGSVHFGAGGTGLSLGAGCNDDEQSISGSYTFAGHGWDRVHVASSDKASDAGWSFTFRLMEGSSLTAQRALTTPSSALPSGRGLARRLAVAR